MDHFFERLEISIVHIGLHEAGTRALVYIPRCWSFLFPYKRLGHRRPLAIGILRASQEAAHSRVQELETVRVGRVAELVGSVLLVERERRVPRHTQVRGSKIRE